LKLSFVKQISLIIIIIINVYRLLAPHKSRKSFFFNFSPVVLM